MHFRLPFLFLVLTGFARLGAAEQLMLHEEGLVNTIIELIRLLKKVLELLLDPPALEPTGAHTSSVPSPTTTFFITTHPGHTVTPITISWPHFTWSSEPTSAVQESSSVPYITVSLIAQSSDAPTHATSQVETPAPQSTTSRSAADKTSAVVATTVSPAPAPPVSSVVSPGKPAPSSISSSQASAPSQAAGNSSRVEPRCYTGNQFPPESEWVPFETLFNDNRRMLQGFNSDQEIKSIHDNLESIAKVGDLNPSLLFAIMLEESRGNCHVVSGDEGLSIGIMQVHGCNVTCHDVAKGLCSASKIKGMISCGVKGTDVFQGLKGCMSQYNNNVGAALRCYNSGSVPDPNDLSKGSGLASYVSDVGNRVVGAQPPRGCDF
ncbi:hypothetical protein KEM54_001580 [Ascosphaera aggregata]|nr:hypothetical protein KEM54_001580 [Ascosphaera aggregata]